MELVSIIVTIIAIIATIVFGYFQIVVPFIRREVRLSREFPFVESTDVPVKRRRKRKKKRPKWLIPVFVIAVVVITVILIRLLVWQTAPRPPKPIDVITFENLTGDEAYDYLCKAIPNLLITNLEQSERLQVMTWERMHDLLKRLNKDDVDTIDKETGYELCRLDSIEAVVHGSFTKAGDVFVTEVKVIDVYTKKLLKTTSCRGEGVASILKNQIDELSKNISRGVGLSEQQIKADKMRITDVTTNSMEAYNYFLRGKEEIAKIQFDEGRKFLEKAVEIDSTFAEAYVDLAAAYYSVGNYKDFKESYEKAMRYIENASDKEQLWIRASYACAKGDEGTWMEYLRQMTIRYPMEKRGYYWRAQWYYSWHMYSDALQNYNKLLKLDPDNAFAINMLAYIFAQLGDFEKALEYVKRYASLCPGDANTFDSMGDIYFQMGNLDDALTKYEEAIGVKKDFIPTYWKIAYIYALREDYTTAIRYIDTCFAIQLPVSYTADVYMERAFFYFWRGRLEKSRKYIQKAHELYKSQEQTDGIAAVYWLMAQISKEQGEFLPARNHLMNWLESRLKDPVYDKCYYGGYYNYYLGMIDIQQRQLDSARHKLSEIKNLLPQIKLLYQQEVMNSLCEYFYAEILCDADSADKVITMGQQITDYNPYSIQAVPYVHSIVYQKDILARAYQKKGDMDNAIAEYERIIPYNPQMDAQRLTHPKCHYELAKLYEQKGLYTKAIAAYEKFLDLWKDADADLPEPHDARKRLARMKAGSRD